MLVADLHERDVLLMSWDVGTKMLVLCIIFLITTRAIMLL
jgi:hypothetical protein